jgi:hypothetical protein
MTQGMVRYGMVWLAHHLLGDMQVHNHVANA